MQSMHGQGDVGDNAATPEALGSKEEEPSDAGSRADAGGCGAAANKKKAKRRGPLIGMPKKGKRKKHKGGPLISQSVTGGARDVAMAENGGFVASSKNSTRHARAKEGESEGDAAARVARRRSAGIRENEDDVEVDAHAQGPVRDDAPSKEVAEVAEVAEDMLADDTRSRTAAPVKPLRKMLHRLVRRFHYSAFVCPEREVWRHLHRAGS